MAPERREIWYRGHVQGVGFRATVAQVAWGHEVTGFVRNLPDGRVHLVCEGDASELKSFLAAISQRMDAFIRDTKEDCQPMTGQFKRFEIRH